jgi:hypothetical protein
MARSGKAVKIGENWYSAFSASSLNGAKVGDDVSFVYTETTKEGTTYRNIKGSVKINSGSAPAAGASEGTPARATASYSKGGRSFPVGPLDPERSIIRQNSLTQANSAVSTYINAMPIGGSKSLSEFVDGIIEIARKFEAYSAGDLDAAEAAEAVETIRKAMEA